MVSVLEDIYVMQLPHKYVMSKVQTVIHIFNLFTIIIIVYFCHEYDMNFILLNEKKKIVPFGSCLL